VLSVVWKSSDEDNILLKLCAWVLKEVTRTRIITDTVLPAKSVSVIIKHKSVTIKHQPSFNTPPNTQAYGR
jgi:hypothetical protein